MRPDTTAPPFAYFGGKTTLAPAIAALLPPHEHYVEPFAGGLSVLLAKRPSKMETVSDLDGRLMLFWRVLRDRTRELARVCALTPHARAEYLACQDVDQDPADGTPAGDLETARRVWVRISQGRGGTQKRTGWRSHMAPHGSSIGMPGYLQAYVGRMAPAAERLARVSLEDRPALELIELYGQHDGVVLYVDPPYLGSTRTGTNYLVDMPSPAQHRALLEALLQVRAAVVLSGYASPLYDEYLGGWDSRSWRSIANGGQLGDRHAERTEVLWCNRTLPDLQVQPGLWEGE